MVHTWWSRRTKVRRVIPISPTRSRSGAISGWAMRLRRVGSMVTTISRWASPRGGRGNPHGAPVTVVGIGVMSGDVFGNGMLQSDNLKLIAAFDHRHIFIDPDPDPAVSYAERKRLYELPNSQWSDYAPLLISAGGGVFRR